jgi:hypothetical protein
MHTALESVQRGPTYANNHDHEVVSSHSFMRPSVQGIALFEQKKRERPFGIARWVSFNDLSARISIEGGIVSPRLVTATTKEDQPWSRHVSLCWRGIRSSSDAGGPGLGLARQRFPVGLRAASGSLGRRQRSRVTSPRQQPGEPAGQGCSV